MPTIKGSNLGKGVVYRRKELWVEDGKGEWSATGQLHIAEFEACRPVLPTGDCWNTA